MAPLKLVNKIWGHKVDRNLGCINGILQMLKSIPEVETMFRTQSYQTGCEDDMPICDEISRLFRTEKKKETSAADLRMLIRVFTEETFTCFGVQQDIEIFFSVLHEVIRKEIDSSNKQSKDLWQKFGRKQKTNVSCSMCKGINKEDTAEFFTIPVPILEGSNTTVSRLIKKIGENEDNDCRMCGENSLAQLPDYLLIKLSRTEATTDSIVFPENEMRLLNGDTYKLSCIVDHDPRTEQYVTSVIDDNTWVHCDGTKHTLACKEDVKTKLNCLYLYVKYEATKSVNKYKCQVSGCPLEEQLKSRKALRSHMEREHPKCVHCKKTFLMNCLFKEHMQGNPECKVVKKFNGKKGNHGKESEMYTDSGLESMSDSTVEEAIKVTVKKNYSGLFEVKNQQSKKRKAEGNDENNVKAVKKHKVCNESTFCEDTTAIQTNNYLHKCKNTGCPHVGEHWCQYPSVISFENFVKTNGIILRKKSLVNGVPKFVPFNNSFLEILGCQFYFKNDGGIIKIFSYSQHKEEYQYQLTLFSEGLTSTLKAKIGEKRTIAAWNLDPSKVEYELIIKTKSYNVLK